MDRNLIRTLVVVFLVSIVVAACGSKVNQANFEKIQTGMTEDEVRKILGPPTETSSMSVMGLSGTSSKWESKSGAIVIQFFNGKVQIKEFSKPGEKVLKPSVKPEKE